MNDFKWLKSFAEYQRIKDGVLFRIAEEWDADLLERDEADADRDAKAKMMCWQHLERRVESPIEFRLAAEIAVGSNGFNHIISTHTEPNGDFYTIVTPQAEVGPYRVDFLFETRLGAHRWLLVVECDGHDYHERTKDQAKRDKKRDRYLQANGYKVLRFTGSEIHADAERCMDEIEGLLFNDIESVLIGKK